MTPFAQDPFRIRRIIVAHGKNPTVEYDREQDLGIPLSLDRVYDAKRAQAALQASAGK
jgi:hypothetical protein